MLIVRKVIQFSSLLEEEEEPEGVADPETVDSNASAEMSQEGVAVTTDIQRVDLGRPTILRQCHVWRTHKTTFSLFWKPVQRGSRGVRVRIQRLPKLGN